MFQGYQTFTRHDSIWSTGSAYWGYSLAPWIALCIILIVFLAWLLHGRIVRHRFSLEIPELAHVDIKSGIAQELPPKKERRKPLYKGVMWLLNFL